IDCDIVGGGLTRKVNAIARRRIGAILQREGLIDESQLEDALELATVEGLPLGQALVRLDYITPEILSRAMSVQREESMGLLDALEGEDVLSCVVPSGIEGLSVMPLGNASSHDAGGLSLAAFRHLLDRAARHFDVII